MQKQQLEQLIREVILEELRMQLGKIDGEESLDEKSVPQPYDRSKRERMTKAQITRRQEIGEKLKKSKKQVKKFKKKYGDDWIDYLWATATSLAMGRNKQ